jgi:hypothetical protein
MTDKDWEFDINVNLKSTRNGTKTVLPITFQGTHEEIHLVRFRNIKRVSLDSLGGGKGYEPCLIRIHGLLIYRYVLPGHLMDGFQGNIFQVPLYPGILVGMGYNLENFISYY